MKLDICGIVDEKQMSPRPDYFYTQNLGFNVLL